MSAFAGRERAKVAARASKIGRMSVLLNDFGGTIRKSACLNQCRRIVAKIKLADQSSAP
ncbi:hypothetical protein RHECNPAF_44600103 [Rhizobium etli CNPAF512]|nr:hypothetical protein RHECNPAF_44600103 [Rhizobium etli CNPAF512]